MSILRTFEVEQALSEGRPEILGSCGRAYMDTQAEVVGENGRQVSPTIIGEIRVRGLGTTLGYWHKEVETVPKKIIFIAGLPLSASGKLLKSTLKQQYSSTLLRSA